MSNIYQGLYKEAYEKFIEFYSPDLIVQPATKKPRLSAKTLRTCRFCKRSFPEVTFNKDAHVLPQFLGNRNLIHDIECDSCNEKFSKYETSFADSIGLFRTADQIKGQRGVPKFKNQGLVVYSKKDASGQEAVFIEADHTSKAEFDENAGTIKLTTLKTPYKPVEVMKSLFKIGYSLLSEDEIADYAHIDRIINTSDWDNHLKDYCKVLKFTFDYHHPHPIVVTFKKKPAFRQTPIPTKIVSLYFGRFMYEYILLNSKDEFMIKKGGQGTVHYMPPYWNQNRKPPTSQLIDLSSTEKKYEEESVVFTFDK